MMSSKKKSPIESKKTRASPDDRVLRKSRREEIIPIIKPNSSPLKLTLKIGGQTLSEKSVTKSSISPSSSLIEHNQYEDEDSEEFAESGDEDIGDNNVDDELEEEQVEEKDAHEVVYAAPRDEEEAWLDALEKGRLNDFDDELKKIKDPKLMTKRQRSLLENKTLKKKEDAMKLILIAKSQAAKQSDAMMSEEMVQRRMIKASKRKQQAEEKKEKDKKQTIDRLLKKKQDAAKAKKKKKSDAPKICYKNNQNGIFICLPEGIPFEFSSGNQTEQTDENLSRISKKCSRQECVNDMKYTCSKTKLPICSLACYKYVNSKSMQEQITQITHLI